MIRNTTAIALTLVCLIAAVSTAGDTGSASKVKVSAQAGQIANGQQNITLTLSVQKGWHIYANPVRNALAESAQTTIAVSSQGQPIAAKVAFPAGKLHVDPKDSTLNCMAYEGSVDIPIQCVRTANSGPLQISVRFVACDANRCLKEATKTITIP